MPKVVITEAGPLDGEYPFDFERFTNRELHIIKKESGVRAGELSDALAALDNDVLVALAVVALRRAGVPMINSEPLWDLPLGAITIDVTDEEEDQAAEPVPPPSEPPSDDAGSETTPDG